MAIDAVACSRCGGQAALTDYNLAHGWACPHCGCSHWPDAHGGWSSPAGSGSAGAVLTAPSVAARIYPTRAAAPGRTTTTTDLVTRPLGLAASPLARVASIVLAGGAVAGLIVVARAALG